MGRAVVFGHYVRHFPSSPFRSEKPPPSIESRWPLALTDNVDDANAIVTRLNREFFFVSTYGFVRCEFYAVDRFEMTNEERDLLARIDSLGEVPEWFQEPAKAAQQSLIDLKAEPTSAPQTISVSRPISEEVLSRLPDSAFEALETLAPHVSMPASDVYSTVGSAAIRLLDNVGFAQACSASPSLDGPLNLAASPFSPETLDDPARSWGVIFGTPTSGVRIRATEAGRAAHAWRKEGKPSGRQTGGLGDPGPDQPPSADDAALCAEAERLSAMDRTILTKLLAKGVIGLDNVDDEAPATKTLIASWTGYGNDSRLGAALAALVRSKLLDNAAHHDGRGGYFLTPRGLKVAKILESEWQS